MSDIEIIDEISADKIKATGVVAISSYSANIGIQSS